MYLWGYIAHSEMPFVGKRKLSFSLFNCQMELRPSTFYCARQRDRSVRALIPENGMISDIASSDDDDPIHSGDSDEDYVPCKSWRKEHLRAESPSPVDSDTDLPSEQPSTSHAATPSTSADVADLCNTKAPRSFARSKKQKRPLALVWESRDVDYSRHFLSEQYGQGEVKAPVSYFKLFFDSAFIELIANETNLYSVRTEGASVNTSAAEIEQFLGILVLMGVVKMPALSDYWSDRLRYPLMADVMPVKRFKKLRRLVHFTSTEDATDKFTKIRPAFELLRGNFRKVEEEKQQSIDEMMVPYKDKRAGKLRQYMKNKPHKWGYKLFVRAGVSGMVYDILPYAGADTFSHVTFSAEEEALGLGGKVVVYLCRTLQNPEESAVFFDNFFCSIELIKYLKETFGTVSLGTIRSPRMRGCPLLEDKALLKKGRGHYDQKTEKTSGVTIIKWVDNKVVNLASNFVGVQPEGTVKRFSKEESKKVAVPCPRIVLEYNNHMGGVDLADMLIELYRTPLKSKRYYLKLFAQLLDISINNAWLLYRRDCRILLNQPALALKDFRVAVGESLLKAGKRKRGRPSFDEVPQKKIRKAKASRPADDVRYDTIGHWPSFGTKGRCRYCSTGQTRVKCTKCDMLLCFTERRNCFWSFHTRGL